MQIGVDGRGAVVLPVHPLNEMISALVLVSYHYLSFILSAPIPNNDSGHNMPLNCLSPPNSDSWREHTDLKRQKSVCSEDKISFDANFETVSQLIKLVRKPAISRFIFIYLTNLDGSQVYNFLCLLVGNLSQRHASVSYVMAESLRFKKMKLYKLLEEFRSRLDAETHGPNTSTNILQPPDKVIVNGVTAYQ